MSFETIFVCVGKILQLTRKKGETVWLQCDVSEYLRSAIEWRWNGRNVQDTHFNNFLLTNEQSKHYYSRTFFSMNQQSSRFNYYQYEYVTQWSIHLFY